MSSMTRTIGRNIKKQGFGERQWRDIRLSAKAFRDAKTLKKARKNNGK